MTTGSDNMFNKKKKQEEPIPEGMIETKDLFLGKVGEVWESRTPTGYRMNYLEDDVTLILKRSVIDDVPEKTIFTDIFTDTVYTSPLIPLSSIVYTYNKDLSAKTVTRVKPLKLKVKYIPLEALEKLYDELNLNTFKKESNLNNKPKSRLRQRRYID